MHQITRWLGHMRPPLSGLQAVRFGYRESAIQQRYPHQSLSAKSSFRQPLPQRHFSALSARQNRASPSQTSSTGTQPPAQQPPRTKGGRFKSWALFNIAGISVFVATAVVVKSVWPNDKNKALNKTSFTPFTIVSKEQVSPTAFVLSVRAGAASATTRARLREAWDHGLWSVEIKQPQLQIARHYTPLPPPPRAHEEEKNNDDSGKNVDEDEEILRFLIRRVDGGEMSTYLSRLRVGGAVWLRGPHLGFDVARRLGSSSSDSTGQAAGRVVVFVAGGTGVAPALQVARRLLDGPEPDETKPAAMSILWANRAAADALGRPLPPTSASGRGSWLPSSWWRCGVQSDKTQERQEQTAEESSLARQIRDLQRRHPSRFYISYFVDAEATRISSQDIQRAAPTSGQQLGLPPAKTCPWHSPAALANLPDDDDAKRQDTACGCGGDGGANLACVSGPDGFVEAYAGAKRWHAGGEMQGPVRGLLGRLLADGDVGGNWLVLKI
ncbi:hypothetical protein GGR52DRAFT_475258 [Hypoxylon sp. FL1284]|nr:hypothetical protein GGR52DRAFT_475258 [Hypoxylon sp. FL1284]